VNLIRLYDDWFVREFEGKVEKLRSYYEEHGIAIFSREQGAGINTSIICGILYF
jgi:hypothetical protein